MMTDFHVDHLSNPRNSGKLKDYDKIIEAKSDYCGDMIRFYIKFNGNKIENVGYEVFGCWAIISACSIMSEYMEGKTIEEQNKKIFYFQTYTTYLPRSLIELVMSGPSGEPKII